VYGAIGTVIVLLLWFYLSGFALLIGAELNSEIDKALPAPERVARETPRRSRNDPLSPRPLLAPACTSSSISTAP
jgi:membrane protein